MNEIEMQDNLKALLDEISFMDADDLNQFDLPPELAGIERTNTFEEAGVLTNNQGLVVHTSDGSKFQVTIVQSR